jgi:hypothetical protein
MPQAIQSWTTEQEYVDLFTEYRSPAELEPWLLDRIEQFTHLRRPDDRFIAGPAAVRAP